MRKGLAILILVSYALCAFGVTFSFHHCKGKLRYVSVAKGKHEKKCCKGKKKMPKGCCHTNKVAFKKADDKGQAYFTIAKKVIDPIYSVTHYPIIVSALTPAYKVESDFHLRPPPERGKSQPLYILHSTFRI